MLRSKSNTPRDSMVVLRVSAVWEMLMGDLPYHGLYEGDIIVGVLQQGLRPPFPPGAPHEYVQLAQDCWAQDPKARPTISTVVKRLEGLIAQEAAAAAAARPCEVGTEGRVCRGPRKPRWLRQKLGFSQTGAGGGQRRRSSLRALFGGQFGRHASSGSIREKDADSAVALGRGDRDGLGVSSAAACVSAGELPIADQQQWVMDL